MRSVQSLAPPEFVAKGSGAPSSVVIMAAAFFGASFAPRSEIVIYARECLESDVLIRLAERFDKEMFMVADSDGLSVGYRDDSRCASSAGGTLK